MMEPLKRHENLCNYDIRIKKNYLKRLLRSVVVFLKCLILADVYFRLIVGESRVIYDKLFRVALT